MPKSRVRGVVGARVFAVRAFWDSIAVTMQVVQLALKLPASIEQEIQESA